MPHRRHDPAHLGHQPVGAGALRRGHARNPRMLLRRPADPRRISDRPGRRPRRHRSAQLQRGRRHRRIRGSGAIQGALDPARRPAARLPASSISRPAALAPCRDRCSMRPLRRWRESRSIPSRDLWSRRGRLDKVRARRPACSAAAPTKYADDEHDIRDVPDRPGPEAYRRAIASSRPTMNIRVVGSVGNGPRAATASNVDMIAISPGERTRRRSSTVCGGDLPRTRVFSFSHILFTTGVKLPVRRTLRAWRANMAAWRSIDGAQRSGAMPVDVKAIGCHAYAVSGHKWLLGPKGTGLLYLSDEMADALDALPLPAGRQPNSDFNRYFATLPDCMASALPSIISRRWARPASRPIICRFGAELHDLLSRIKPSRRSGPSRGPTCFRAILTFRLPGSSTSTRSDAILLLRHKIYLRVVEQAGFAGFELLCTSTTNRKTSTALVEALKEELAA